MTLSQWQRNEIENRWDPEEPEVYREGCCPIEINANGDGPEVNPERVTDTRCLQHEWESWPCRYNGSRWHVTCELGKHPDGRRWQRWTVYLDGKSAFASPSQELAESGIEEWSRSGHGVAPVGEAES